MMRRHRSWLVNVLAPLTFCVSLGLAAAPVTAADSETKQILMVAGPPSHRFGAHEHFAGLRILQDAIQQSSDTARVTLVRGWPSDEQIAAADTIVIYCDGGGRHVAMNHRDQLRQRLGEGTGLVCLHYAVEMLPGESGKDWEELLGGHFEINYSVNPHWVAEFKSLPDHPITRGVEPFATDDEWYFHLRFTELGKVTPILSAVAPDHTMKRPDGPHHGNPHVRKSVAAGEPQTVAWAYDRPDGGRSFGFTGGHYHWNWGNDDVRRLVTNAILWTAGETIGPEGCSLGEKPIGIKRLLEDQDYERPEDFDEEETAKRFHLTAEKKKATESAEPIFLSDTLTSETKRHRVEIDASIDGVSDLFLIVDDGGDGFACDWVDWVDPTLHGPAGSLSLIDLGWHSATTGWGSVRKDSNCSGNPWSVDGQVIGKHAIGTHANSVIHFKVPEGYTRLTVTGALDTGGTRQNGGTSTSVRLAVYAGAAPASLGSAPDNSSDGDQRDPANAIKGITIAEGLEATLAASEPLLRSLTNLDIDSRGRVWVCDVMNYRRNQGARPEGDRIMILEDTDGDGVMDEAKTFYQGREIDSAMGICVLENATGTDVIVTASPNVWRFVDTDGDDVPDSKTAMFTGVGNPQHDHSGHSFLFGPDGKLYWNFGNTGEQVKDPQGETVIDIHGRPVIDNGAPLYGGMPFRCDLDGSHFEVLAHNFRNNWETTVDSFGTLWQSDNDDDGNRGTRINFVIEHGNYGYRDEITGGGWREERINQEDEIMHRHWHLNDPGVVPNMLQTGAGSPSGICFYEGRLLPQRFWDQIIHCDPGPNMVRAYPAKPDGAGYTATIEPLMTGTTDRWFRPADVCTAPDGSLFVTDWYDPGVGGHNQGDSDRGRLFRLAPPGSAYSIPTFDFTTAGGAVEALRNPNLAVRSRAWRTLHAMGRDAEPELLELYADPNPRLRARALWLLGKIDGRGEHYVAKALADSNPDIRITAIRLAKQLTDQPSQWLADVADDESPAVRRELAVALRYDTSDAMPTLWAKLATAYDGQDRWYLEALGIGSDVRPEACFEAYLDAVNGRWDTAAGRDLVWRIRAPKAADAMVSLIADPDRPLRETDRYFRSLEFHDSDVRSAALKRLLP
ncbi:ThuA domain-containing protein [Stieleria sp. ICT_E10.1]|uniref:PVC-type heme-binding CxxCH protein n=1 Tax=Stieleria sedimenti TaxID=2976331 RepID=UPI00217F5AEB|nr:PVC-type heme-binding CxxCH protein [Stieleria sedimenti]MCS7471297.1 ThuA domain-containing protein [Stieleria sedimenti]